MTPTKNTIITPTEDTIARVIYPNTPNHLITVIPTLDYSQHLTRPPMEEWGSLLDNISQDEDATLTYDGQFVQNKKEIRDNHTVLLAQRKTRLKVGEIDVQFRTKTWVNS